MIRLNYSQFMSFPFVESFKKLANQSFPTSTAYAVKKIGDQFQKQRETIQAEYRQLVDQFATRDEAGAIVHPDPKDTNGFDVAPEKMDEYKKAEDAFGLKEFVIQRPQLDISVLGSAQFTASELMVLGDLISDPETVPASSVASVTQIGSAALPAEPEQSDAPSSA